MRNIKSFLANLSNHPGVYQMLGENGVVLYVGKARDVKKRISSYFGAKGKTADRKTQSLLAQVKDIGITITHNENEAVLLECNLIKKHRPRYNVLLRDDKSYPYIVISIQQAFPRIDFYRGARKKNALYFGPYPSAYSVRETISLLQKLFGLRSCRDNYFDARSRPCLLFQIGLCSRACAGLISQQEYAKSVKLAILFLEGKNDLVIEELQNRMEDASKELDFERAAHIRDQIRRLRQIQEKQYINVGKGEADIIGLAVQAGVICIQLLTIRDGQILGSRAYFPIVPTYVSEGEIISAFVSQHYLSHPSHIESIPKEIVIEQTIPDARLLQHVLAEQAGHNVKLIVASRGEKKQWLAMAKSSAKQALVAHLISKTNVKERFAALQSILQSKDLGRIECFDISHILGEATVASCVVFDLHGPVKSDYRRFNIKSVKASDDIQAMRQVLERRFKRLQKEGGIMPDVILIDGGATQLKIVHETLTTLNISQPILIGISKGPDRKPGFETLHFVDQPPMHLPRDALALHFLQQIRDEAHRFAITGHRNRRDKSRRQSTLELIPGIGRKRRRELLRYFGGIQGLAHASLEELMKVPGISRFLAERIFATLHDTTL